MPSPTAQAAEHAAAMPTTGLAARIASIDWMQIADALDAYGCARLPGLLAPGACIALAGCYDDAARFRSRVVMALHGFGSGEYQYFAAPLPALVTTLRTALYGPLAVIANRWNASMGEDTRFPDTHADFLARCRAAEQTRPTPLLLRYEEGDYNCLHQDLYGDLVFPLQVAVLLSRPDTDFSGGEFVLTEQRPRRQSRVEVVPLAQGDAVVFAVSHRPIRGARGTSRATLRHGVSRVRSGRRTTLGVIFHDAT